ncbi:MAG: metalloregulator ArsR/SmtB family transcription factor [Anaerolineae bacterium]|nr:metalloregulator ArsR/SmtB family transcription factor [Anaerolineae bacterium]
MNMNLRDEINRLHAQVCSGLSDPNRIMILYTLSEHPSNVSDLAEEIGLTQPTVSRHLKVLRERGMVASQREGQAVIYTLTDDRIIQALDLIRSMLADNLKSQAALLSQRT